eukprot:TRINITY_DN20887_c0_g1_i1.p1 TRINITY_DN20887_c0_g1~~TRINITY_DN20887_c0_g1_i1.p1  ORF type:complete len:259 (+),score=22.69 TRINITY_DN20887_c0_g1_i1:90-866(+)
METIVCRSCLNKIPRVSKYCLICGHSVKAAGSSPDPKLMTIWAIKKMEKLPSCVKRLITSFAPRGLNGRGSRWMPYQKDLMPTGVGSKITYPLPTADDNDDYGGYSAMWNRCLPRNWGVSSFTILLRTSCETLVENLYLIGLCRPTDLQQEADDNLPLRQYPVSCFALQIGGGKNCLHLALDGEGTQLTPLSDCLHEESDTAIITLTVDTSKEVAAAQFFVNSLPAGPVMELPSGWKGDQCHPFVSLNTQGDSAQWVA